MEEAIPLLSKFSGLCLPTSPAVPELVLEGGAWGQG